MLRYISLLFFAGLLLSACASTEPVSVFPDIDHQASLPVFASEYPEKSLALRVTFHIQEDGSVETVVIHNSSGDEEWDKAAKDSLKLWTFHPETISEAIWVRRVLEIQIEEVVQVHLAYLKFSDSERALEVYQLLKSGASFADFSDIDVEEEAEIMYFSPRFSLLTEWPMHIRPHLEKLRVSKFTKPLPIEDSYYIFKRIPRNLSHSL